MARSLDIPGEMLAASSLVVNTGVGSPERDTPGFGTFSEMT